MQKLYFCTCEKAFFALRKEHRKTCSALSLGRLKTAFLA
ncbi:Uncharacterized protein dnm_094340 [Desulfonema magnum]|uniref:Uncharacterized protein n=1 Tax=Desulfonema magnum TaxID=45655 RepID=A0A975BXW0_9BACT|nr:Uncharacterized protein dnm_094340 [Desulfonema magnum]